ncbi:MAG: cell surface protein SprA [Bacteroidetes bacterium]|nr:MAG: cell surface protein SprA [Bacteroidota bacterium]TAF94070.1 MAG: cell surface protein SprA [Bacteroidota bacterium]
MRLYIIFILWVLALPISVRLHAQDSLKYPIKDTRGPVLGNARRSMDFKMDSLVKKSIEYDPVTKQYVIVEKIGNQYYRKPMSVGFDEFWQQQNRVSDVAYYQQRARTMQALNQKTKRPPVQAYPKLFDRIFGIGPNGMKVDIRPQGNVDLFLGYQGQRIKNPTLPERARRNGGFDFDMNANLNVIGNIGDKLKLPINYNTLANFDFENQLKLDYKGMDDEILKSVEAGNISFQSKGTLIPSSQSLFGIKTQLQFGKLFVTTALANQRAQRQAVNLQGGGIAQQINKSLDDYEDNRHFLLGQYFKNNYNRAMSNLPVVNSQVQILRMEVWITHRTAATNDVRDVVGFMDLGETNPFRTGIIQPLTGNPVPSNGANTLYSTLTADPANRNPSTVTARLQGLGLRQVEDFEKVFARKLNPSEYYFNPQVGFISLNQTLQPDEVLAVAYQYTFNGRTFQVGEFSQEIAVDSTQGVQRVLFLKLLKATSARVNLPIWQLMMKNIYSLDVAGISQPDFKLNILYQEPSSGFKRFLPETSPSVEGRPLISILKADRLNNRNDPQPDGLYDFVDGFTVLPQQGKIIFPVLEPFGRDLDTLAFGGLPQPVKNKYVYYQLYDSIKAIAQTFANLNRFIAQGSAKGSSSSEIYLGAFNIPQGSVTVTAGGQLLREGVDYSIDYNLGSLKIINPAISNAGLPVQVQFENNGTFGIQQRSFFGLRLDYMASKKLNVGASLTRLRERPFFTKMNFGEDPIRNTMYGLDFSYRSDLPRLTKWLDKLPFYSTTAMSSVNAYGEAALLQPGHPPQIGKGENGLIYIDDFEGTRNSIDLRFPFVAWTLASTPQGNGLFPEGSLPDSLDYNKNRAKLAWYNIEPVLQDKDNPNNPVRRNLDELSDPRVRAVFTRELFPQRTTNITDVQTATFDMAYYPTEKGPYNFEARSSEIDANGRLRNPRNRWGGIMRNIDQTDFETGNVEFVEFWVQDPFIRNPNSNGGKLYLNLGNVSEDVLKDGKRFYENGMPTPNQPAAVDSSNAWGRTPVNPIQVTQAFSNDPADRPFQDVGFDGYSNTDERRKHARYLQALSTVVNAATLQRFQNDPGNDDYVWYRNGLYDARGTGILGRYKAFNNPEGNSSVAEGGAQFSSAATLFPDNEDLNRDNTLNESEEFYEYEVDLKPGMNVSNSRFITDVRNVNIRYANGSTGNERWYLFRVPIRDFNRRVGNIPDFKSIRFIRMFMSGFEDSVVLRFARLDLVRNQWRNFTFKLDTVGQYNPLPANTGTVLNTLAVNVEENSNRTPIPYRIPPGIERVQFLSNNGVNLLQNEQSMSLKITDLQEGDARAVFKTLNLDLRQYGQLNMFIHAESVLGARPVNNGDLNAVIRIGQDFLNNYYEIKIPLQVTPFNSNASDTLVWPAANNLDFALQELVNLKLRRNAGGASLGNIYRERIGNKTYSLLGNPNLAEVRGILFAVENAQGGVTSPLSTEVWINELRLSRIDEKGGWAALGRVDFKLADLGTFSVSANTYTQGFGAIEQRVNERARDNMVQFDAATQIDVGKLVPKSAGASIPVFASINRTIKTPEYDPFDQDVFFKDKLRTATNRDSVRRAALDQTTITTLNFTNVRFGQNAKKNRLWNLKNFDFSYSYIRTTQTTPVITQNQVTRHRVGLGYTYNSAPKFVEPFKKLFRNKSAWFSLVRDFNFNLKPQLLGVRVDVNRQFGQFIPRIVSFDGKIDRVDTTYDKFFTFDRFYNMRWDMSRSLNFDFTASNMARVDEPFGSLNTQAKRDTVRRNFLNGGRNTDYKQKAIVSYTFPLSKFPMTDWITARYNYSTGYNWLAASLLARNFGNFLENSQENTFNGEFDFTRLYQKSRFFRNLENGPSVSVNNAPSKGSQRNKKPETLNVPAAKASFDPMANIPTREEVVKNKKGREKVLALRKWRELKRNARQQARQMRMNEPMELNPFVRTGGQLLTMLKRVSVNYSENFRSRVPGFMDSARLLGNNFASMQPGLDYVFGGQPNQAWLRDKANKGLISRDSTFNLMFRQNFEQRLGVTAQLEPIRELIIDVNIDKSYNKEYSELFKDTTGSGNNFGHLSPYAAGGFSVSYIAFNTLFEKIQQGQLSNTFKEFQENRVSISRRVAEGNPYWQSLPQSQKFTADGFARGYGKYSQDVLIPAFIAAYTGRDVSSVSLLNQNNSSIRSNPFRGIRPLPNWRLTYTGLTRLPGLQQKFSNIAVTHGYSGTLSMNSFTSALNYLDPFRLNAPGFIDTISGNYVPFFLVPNLTMQEQFMPLIGFDVTTVDQMNIKFEYKKSRQLSLSLVDYQLSEVRSTEWVIGGSYRKRGVRLPFKIPGMKGKKLENDINVRLDLSMRDDIQTNSRLDQPNSFGTGGQKVIQIQPSIDYVLNNRFNVKLYFNQRRVIPYISTSAPTTDTRAGIQIRISLAQ